MRKYFTWRCMVLHVLLIVLVPTFLLLGRWQYHAALSGNTLSWAYTFEWPAFAVYAVYTWWNLIHQRSTALDRIRDARDRAASAAAGVSIEKLPGWALDKSLAKTFTEASLGKEQSPALSAGAVAHAIETERGVLDDPERANRPTGASTRSTDGPAALAGAGAPSGSDIVDTAAEEVVEARVVDVKVAVDEELAAYNRYLAELSASDPPKRW